MKDYRKFIEKFDEIARRNFNSYEKALKRYEDARRVRSENPVKSGWGVTPESQIKAHEAEAEFLEAEQAYKKAKQAFEESSQEIATLRNDLVEEVRLSLLADPEALDKNVVSLLESGICSPVEIANLYDKAGSVTTKRFIAEHAKSIKLPVDDYDNQAILNGVVGDASELKNPEKNNSVQMFDALTDVYSRCQSNPRMIGSWGMFVEECKETMEC